ncbi:MAG: DUF4339 domain-containing protein [Muribaculaceae bacterium]|jgi:hypothetical protein|nr:DUF4339 domain-containing protein [Muribaculaceae bacterium]
MNYFIPDSNNQPQGPFNIEQLRARGITPDTLVYNEQLGNWTPAAQVPELATYLFGGAQNPMSLPNGGYQSCNQPPYPQYAPGMADNQMPQVAPKTWLVESILVTLFCCLPFGIVGIIKAASVDSKFRSGDYAGAQLASQEAGKWTKWGFFCGIGVSVLYLLLVLLGAVGSNL